MTKRNLPRNPKPRKGMKTNLKTEPPKDLEWFATSKAFSHVEFEESILDFSNFGC